VLSIFFIGIALSMDAFSIAISLGTMKLTKAKKLITALLFSFMHFSLTILALFISESLSQLFNINFTIILILIFFYSGYVMIFNENKIEEKFDYKILNIILLAFSVSVDSFSVGLVLKVYGNSILSSAIIFSICSFLATYLGLFLGECGAKYLKEKAPILGGLIFWVFAFVNILKYFQ